MIPVTVKKVFVTVICLIVLNRSYSQQIAMGPFHFDDTYNHAHPGNALYKAYSQKVNNSFLTTLYSEPAVKAATLTFSDKFLSRKHGEITVYNEKGSVMFTGNYKNNRLHGRWSSWYPNLVICDSGNFKNNLPDGVWKTWYPDGDLRSVRTFNSYKYESLMNEIRRNNNRLSFFYLTSVSKQNKSLFNYHTNAGNSYTTLAMGNQQNSRTNISLKELAEINTTVDTEDYLPPFTKGLHHGLYMNLYPGGAVKDSGYYKNGLRDGIWEEWIENGVVRSIGFYQHGLKKNTWKFFNAKGKLLYYQHYDRHGRPDHAKEFVDY